MIKDAISTYKGFLDALDAGEKNVKVTEELYTWLSENIREAETENIKGAPVSMSLYGVNVYKVKD